MRDKQVEIEVGRLITKLQWKLYNENGFTLEEVGDIFKTSRQSVEQRLKKYNYKLRKKSGGTKVITKWQREYYTRLCGFGLSEKEASKVIGISNFIRVGDLNGLRGHNGPFNIAILNKVWDQFIDDLVASMWGNKASTSEISTIIGIKTKSLENKIHRLRDKGIKLDKRRKVKN